MPDCGTGPNQRGFFTFPVEYSGSPGLRTISLRATDGHANVEPAALNHSITWAGQPSSGYLKAHNTAVQNYFGRGVKVNGSTLIVGAPYENFIATGVNPGPGLTSDVPYNAGAAYIFVRSGPSWIQQAYLKPDVNPANMNFGASVDVDGDTAVVGAPNANNQEGAVFVFSRSGTTWTQTARLAPAIPRQGDAFGNSVAISGSMIVVGAPSEPSSGTGVNSVPNTLQSGSGAAYVFVNTNGTWTQRWFLKPNDTHGDMAFGVSVATDGNAVIVGSTQNRECGVLFDAPSGDRSCVYSGAAYAFVRHVGGGGSMAFSTRMKPTDFGLNQRFGTSVAVSNGIVVVGSPGSRGTGNTHPGAAFVFRYTTPDQFSESWTYDSKLLPTSVDGDGTGSSVDIDSGTILIGSPGYDLDGAGNDVTAIGAAFSYISTGTSWAQGPTYRAGNGESGDSFGLSVALSGSHRIISAPYEDSAAIGTGGNQLDNSATNSGAVYASP